ncbi:MAG: hypothetical protein HY329_23970 [Chloroflexi bacterium]|nr:hypothetical protein [Chloroflexota bacterium]
MDADLPLRSGEDPRASGARRPSSVIRPGVLAPDVVLLAEDGTEARLGDWRGRPLLVVFLRWLG